MKRFVAGLTVALGMVAVVLTLAASPAAAESGSGQEAGTEYPCRTEHFPYN